MTIQELINHLSGLENKSRGVFIYSDNNDPLPLTAERIDDTISDRLDFNNL